MKTLLLIALLVVTPILALAQTAHVGVDGILVNPAKAPVKLDVCNVQPGSPQWTIQVGLTNRSDTVITDVQVRLQHEDSFGGILQTDTITARGPFKPHTSYHPFPAGFVNNDDETETAALYFTVGETRMPSPANFSKERCTVMATLDASGKVWKYHGK